MVFLPSTKYLIVERKKTRGLKRHMINGICIRSQCVQTLFLTCKPNFCDCHLTIILGVHYIFE